MQTGGGLLCKFLPPRLCSLIPPPTACPSPALLSQASRTYWNPFNDSNHLLPLLVISQPLLLPSSAPPSAFPGGVPVSCLPGGSLTPLPSISAQVQGVSDPSPPSPLRLPALYNHPALLLPLRPRPPTPGSPTSVPTCLGPSVFRAVLVVLWPPLVSLLAFKQRSS